METLQRTANRGSVSTGYDIDNSAAFGGANGIQFNPSSDGNQRTWTMSLWVKRSEIGVETTIFGAQNTAMVFMSPDWFRFHLYTGSTTYYYDTDNTGTVFRDTSAWYHFVFQCDTTQGTAANRTKLYINGALYTGARGGADTSANIPQNTEFRLNNNAVNFNVGYFYAGGEQLDGYLAEVNFTDGVANDADAFGEYDEDSGIWKPKAYEGSYGTNGFYLEFKESAASATGIGKDTSGNGHNFSTGGAYPSQSTDTPTNNFATLNQLQLDGSVINNSATITEGATKATAKEFDVYNTFASTIGVTSGKWYAEFEYEGNQADNLVGIADISAIVPYNSRLGKAGQWSVGFYQANGKLYITADSGTTEQANWGASAADGDIISVAVDMDNYFVYFAKNGTYQNSGDPTTGATGTGGVAFDSNRVVAIACSSYDQGGNEGQIYTNFGGYTAGTISSAASDANGYGTFEYAPPTGYYALCTKNLALYGG